MKTYYVRLTSKDGRDWSLTVKANSEKEAGEKAVKEATSQQPQRIWMVEYVW